MINTLIARILPFMPKNLVWLFSKEYIAGETIEEAIENAKKLNAEGVMTTITTGMGEEWKPLYLIGTVYSDENSDGLQSVGEGISGAKVIISSADEAFDSEEFKETATNGAGMFTAPVDMGSYLVTISVAGEEPVEYAVSVESENVWLEHRLIWSEQEEGE